MLVWYAAVRQHLSSMSLLWYVGLYWKLQHVHEDYLTPGPQDNGPGGSLQGEGPTVPGSVECHCEGGRAGSATEEEPELCHAVLHAV